MIETVLIVRHAVRTRVIPRAVFHHPHHTAIMNLGPTFATLFSNSCLCFVTSHLTRTLKPTLVEPTVLCPFTMTFFLTAMPHIVSGDLHCGPYYGRVQRDFHQISDRHSYRSSVDVERRPTVQRACRLSFQCRATS